jgi:hypothetical protein
MRNLAAKWLLALWAMALIGAAGAASARADVTVAPNGCEITLSEPGAVGVVIAYDGLGIEDPYVIENGTGTIDMLDKYQIVYAAGSYTATWSDGWVDHFTLTCPEDYEPAIADPNYDEPSLAPDEVLMPDDWIAPEPTPEPDPTDPPDAVACGTADAPPCDDLPPDPHGPVRL